MENQLPSINKLAQALAKAQGSFRTPEINRTAEVKKEGKLLYETHYADLQEIIDCLRKPLSENGLCFLQITRQIDKNWFLVLELIHESGETKESYLPLNVSQTSQQLGSTLTYLKRYQLSAFFGLAADFDDDGGATEGKQVDFGTKGPKADKGASPQIKPVSNPPQSAPKPSPVTAKKPNHVPASLESLSELEAAFKARGLTDEDLTHLVRVGFGWQSAQLPQFLVDRMIEIVRTQAINSEKVREIASEMQSERQGKTTPQAKPDPADFIMPLGKEGVKGQPLNKLNESTLKDILSWAKGELEKTPPVKNMSEVFEIRANVAAHLASFGIS